VRRLFKRLDEDGSGSVDVAELTDGLIKFKMASSPEAVTRLIAENNLDADGDGSISREEFERAFAGVQHEVAAEQGDVPESVRQVRKLFRSMDDDGSGWVDERELCEGMIKAGLAFSYSEVRIIIEKYELDKDGDGRITLEEFEDVYQVL